MKRRRREAPKARSAEGALRRRRAAPKARSAEGAKRRRREKEARKEQQLRFRHPCHIRGWSKGWRARGDGDALEDAGEGGGKVLGEQTEREGC